MFPVTYGYGKAKIILHANGRIEGSSKELEEELANAEAHNGASLVEMNYWLLLKELKRAGL